METMNVKTVNTEYGEMKYYGNDYFIAIELDQGRLYEQDYVLLHLSKHIKKSKVILDIGAHIGCHSVLYSHLNNKSQIYSFELQKMMYNLLKQNIQNNGIDNVKIYNCAIGDSIKMINVCNHISDGPNRHEEYAYDNHKQYNFGGVSIGHGHEERMMITIDSLNLSGCDFMKIDIEGYEYFAVIGAINTIIKYKPVIFYEANYKTPTDYMKEVNSLRRSITEEMSIIQLLKSIGYNHFEYTDEEKYNILAEYR